MAIRNLAHAQRMLDHLQKPSDPRDPDVRPIPEPGTFYLEYRRQLAASEQVKGIAMMLANAHYLYEGWPTPGHVSIRHTKEAERAIRACSEPCRSAATTAMEEYVVTELERMDEAVLRRPCDWPRERIETKRREIARIGREVFDWHLLNEVGRSSHELRQFEDTSLEDPTDGE